VCASAIPLTAAFKFEIEQQVLRNVQRLVEQNYVNGRPRHHLPSARRKVFEPGASVFYIVDHGEFIQMSDEEIQLIARRRHIVVRNVPQRKFNWNLETLSEFGDVGQLREIQGTVHSCSACETLTDCHAVGKHREDPAVPGMLRTGTMEDIVSEADERVLVCLSLPTSSAEIVNTPGLRYDYNLS
jgi:hypothetical protein